MPQLGLHQDDAIYLITAKSLAEGHGLRIESLLQQPFQTKYPPLFPILLASIWKFGPGFPRNLPWATSGAWVLLPVSLLVLIRLFQRFGFAKWEVWLLTIAVGTHPLVCLWSTVLMSDLLFLPLFLGCLILTERSLDTYEPAWLAVAAGLIAGFAYLTRTAALPLAVSAPLCFFVRRHYLRGLLFLCGMLPSLIGWQVWIATHRILTDDPALLYYTSYLGLQFATIHLDNLLRVLWVNLDSLLRSIGQLVVGYPIWSNAVLERVIAVAAICGAVRLVRSSKQFQYPAAALGMALLLAGYLSPADERLGVPLYPLALMGFLTEIKHLLQLLRAAWTGDNFRERLLATVAGAAVATFVIYAAACYVVGDVVFLPRLYARCESRVAAHSGAYGWLRTHSPPQAAVYAYDDGLLYLHTGRRALGLTMPYARAYGTDPEGEADRFVRGVAGNACRHGVDYLLVTTEDFNREGHDRLSYILAAHDHRLRREFLDGEAAVYRCLSTE